MDILKFKKGLEENLPKELEKDTFYISTDTKKIRLNDSVWEDNGYLKELIYKNEKVTSLALNVLNDKINILDEVVNENEKMSSLIANDLNKKFNTLNNVVNENENEITNSIQEINLSVEENHNTINELIEIVKENEDVVSNAIVYLNKAIPTPQDENSTVTVNDKQYVYKGEDEKNIVSNLSIVTDENEAKIYAYNWGSGIQEHILPSATHDLSGVMAASDKKNLDRVNEFINEIENLTFDSLIKVTYNELVKLRNNNELIAGMKYRITDYVTTTSQENTQSAGHQFDIIVEALSENTLSEDAKAIQNENDGYFDESNLEAWELKYCLDNDTSRFAWAIENKTIVTENYRIKPELINGNTFVEPFTFDGQILIDTAEFVYEDGKEDDIIYEWGYETEPNGEDSLYIIKNGVGYESEGMDYDDKHYYRGTINIDGEVYDKWEKYEVHQDEYYISDAGGVYFLTKSIVEEGSSEITSGGKGVIYYMKDEHNNECPYDFKNIQFVRYKLNPPTVGGYGNEWQNRMSENINKMFEDNQLSYLWHGSSNGEYYWEDEISDVFSTATEETKAFYTFSNVINDEITDKSLTDVCYSNVIKESYENEVLKLNNNIFFSKNINSYCYSNSFGNNCYFNSFGHNCTSNSFGHNCNYNSFGHNCNSNIFGNYCGFNSFGNYCNSNSFGNDCTSNSFGNGCNSNSFGNDCTSNSFGNGCNSNSFGNDCNSNSFGNGCNSNSFGNDCNSNSFGNGCGFNSFSNDCNSNSFGNYCNSNSFGNDCGYNNFGDFCNSNSFGNDCFSNSFGDDCYSNSFGNNCYDNSFGNGCGFNSFSNDCNSNSFGNDCYINSLGNGCFSNSFGNYCNSNSFGNDCYYNGFYDDSSYSYNGDFDEYIGDGNKLNYVQYVTLNEGCHHLLFHTSEVINEENKVQNITVTKRVKSIETNDDDYFVPLLLEIPVTNNEYEIKIARNNNGDIKMYCEADLIG